MQAIKKGIKRVAALAGSAVMIGSTLASPVLAAPTLENWTGAFLTDGAPNGKFVIGSKPEASADVLASVGMAAAWGQAALMKAEVSGGSGGVATLTKTSVAGKKYEYGLAASGHGTASTDNEINKIAFGDFKKGLLVSSDDGGGFHDYHGMDFLMDDTVKTKKQSDPFRVYEVVTFKQSTMADNGFTIDKDEVRFEVDQDVFLYRVFIEAPTDKDYDGTGATTRDKGHTNVMNYAEKDGTAAADNYLGTDNYLPLVIFGRDVRLTDISTDSGEINVLVGDLLTIEKGKTTTYNGYSITLTDISSGGDVGYFEVVEPDGSRSIFTATYGDDTSDAASESGTFGDLTLEQHESDCFISPTAAMLWAGIGDITKTISSSSNAEWVDSTNEETDWKFQGITCENANTGTYSSGSLTYTGLYTSAGDGINPTDDGRTCFLEWMYEEERTDDDSVTVGAPIDAPDKYFSLEYLGLNVDPTTKINVEWKTGQSTPYDSSGTNKKSMNGYIITPDDGTLLIANARPVKDIRVMFPGNSFTATGVTCTSAGTTATTSVETVSYSTGFVTEESTTDHIDPSCVFVAYKDTDDSVKFYKTMADLTDKHFADATVTTPTGGVEENDINLLAKLYLGGAIYELGVIDAPAAASVDRYGDLIVGAKNSDTNEVEFTYWVSMDWAQPDDSSLDETEFETLKFFSTDTDTNTFTKADSLSTQEETQITYNGITVEDPKDSVDDNAIDFLVATDPMRGVIALSAGVSTEESTLKKGDTVGEYTVKDIVPETMGDAEYYTYEDIMVNVAVLDAEVSDIKTEGNLILVGGPVANSVTAQLGYEKWDFCGDADEELPCDNPMAVLEMKDIPGSSNYALVVAGWEGIHTRGAGYVAAMYKNFESDLTGKSKVSIKLKAETVPIESSNIEFV